MTVATNVWATSSTGGAGDLTMLAVPSGPFQGNALFSSVWGSGAPNPWVDYEIIEWADATLTTIKQVEIGQAQLSGGNVLKRSTGVVVQTYLFGTGVKPSVPLVTAPTALTIGATAANIRITCAPHAGYIQQWPRFRNDTNAGITQQADNLGWPTAHMGSLEVSVPNTTGIRTLVAGTLYYFPVQIVRTGNYTKATIYVATGVSGSGRFGLYQDDGTGWPGALIVDWGVTGAFVLNSAGLQTVTLASPAFLVTGWYWGVFQASSAATIAAMHIQYDNPGGTFDGGVTFACAQKTGTYGALASTGVASSGFTMGTSNNLGTPAVLLK